MFRSFDAASDVSSVTAVKSSVVRGIKRSIVEMYPSIEPYIEDIVPKDGVKEGKGKDKMTFVVVEGTPLFFRVREGPYFPTLHLLHQCAFASPPAPLRSGIELKSAHSLTSQCLPLAPPLAPTRPDPLMMARVCVDKGAIKFVLKGADVMCPGLTSAGGSMATPLPEGAPVAVYAEGKEHALALGVMALSTDAVRSVNKGVAIETMHFQGDELFKTQKME